MCISNIGNRRPYQAASMAVSSMPQDASSMVSRVALKEDFLSAPASPTSAVDTPEHDVDTSKPHIVVQHNYHDHSNDNRADYQEEQPARGGVTTPFPLKLHEMLETIAADGFDHVVSWQPHGRCFVVHKPKEFVDLLPTYFKLSKLASFQRQLNLYGFQRLTRGRDRGGYYHELFLQGKVFLAHAIQRIKVKGTGVRARSNPDQEPDFWTMPWVDASSQSNSSSKFASMPALNANASAEQKMMERFPCIDKAVAQLPLQLNPHVPKPASVDKSDFVLEVFGERTFHYLDPFQPTTQGNWTVAGVDELLSTEAESFFEDFEFPQDIGADIEDDDVFGDMLEQMIA